MHNLQHCKLAHVCCSTCTTNKQINKANRQTNKQKQTNKQIKKNKQTNKERKTNRQTNKQNRYQVISLGKSQSPRLTLYGEVDCLPLRLKPQLCIGGVDLREASPPTTHGGDKPCRGTVNGLGLSTLVNWGQFQRECLVSRKSRSLLGARSAQLHTMAYSLK